MKASKCVRSLSILLAFSAFALAPKTTMAASDVATMTWGGASCGYTGYGVGWMGSYSPAGLTGGGAVSQLYDYLDPFGICPLGRGAWAMFSVSGFSSNPGAGWLNSVTCGSVTKPGVGANYFYINGIAAWTWNGIFAFALIAPSGTTTCTVDHN